MGIEKISVVMACYHGDRLDAMKEAVSSVLQQTLDIFEFIIIEDGPVSDSIENYLVELENVESNVRVIRRPKNQGVAAARNHAMSQSLGDYIAIMDSDDIIVPNRLEVQLLAINENNVDAVWGWQEEFYDNTREFAGIKKCPEFHDDIVKSLKWRCLLPDPTTFMKRCCYEKTGGYGNVKTLGMDYMFFLEMAVKGCKLYCVQMPLIKVRISPEQRKRRGGLSLLKEDYVLRRWMLKKNLLKIKDFILIMLVFTVFRLQPNGMRDWVYRKILRK